jgi:metal-responsive CopG/Arc/MetJ family transcriptional regulator
LPRTITSLIDRVENVRVQIRLPGAMTREVDRIVREHPELNYNRQQFVESAVREKIERIKFLEGALASGGFIRVRDHLRPL